jgi:hypothetical protein
MGQPSCCASELVATFPGAPTGGGSFNSWTAGDPLPALPAGVAAAEAQSGTGVSTGSATPSTSTALGYGFTTDSPSPATAQGTVTFTNTATAAVPVASFGSYTGSGNVNVSAADYSEGTYASDSAGFNGASVPTSLVACATYTVLGAATPEVPNALLLPVAAARHRRGCSLRRTPSSSGYRLTRHAPLPTTRSRQGQAAPGPRPRAA